MKSLAGYLGPAGAVAALLASTALAAPPNGMDKAKQTQVALQTAAQFVEQYADEQFAYPGPVNEFVQFGTLRETLNGMRFQNFVDKDAWGHDLFYGTNGKTYM